MDTPVILAVTLVLLLSILTAGCTSEITGSSPATFSPAPPPSMVTHVMTIPVTQPPVTVDPTASPARVPEPVQELPPGRQVNLALTKDRPTSGIHLLFQGGPGEIYVTRVIMRVYTSETAYTEYIMSNGAKPIPGDEIVAPGTRGGDRVEVFVISSGMRYKVTDEPVYGGMYY